MKGRGVLLLVGVVALGLVAWGASRLMSSGAENAGKGAVSAVVDAFSSAVSATLDAAAAVFTAPKLVVDAATAGLKETDVGKDIAEASTWEGIANEAGAALDVFLENATSPADAVASAWDYWTNGDGIGGK